MYAKMEAMLSRGTHGEPNLRRRGVYIVFTFCEDKPSHFRNQPSSPGQELRDCFLFPLGTVYDSCGLRGKQEPQRVPIGITPSRVSGTYSDACFGSDQIPKPCPTVCLSSLLTTLPFFFFFLPSELSEEKELVAEALEKGTLPLLKEQVRQPRLRTGVTVEVNGHALKGPRSPRVLSLPTSQSSVSSHPSSWFVTIPRAYSFQDNLGWVFRLCCLPKKEGGKLVSPRMALGTILSANADGLAVPMSLC